jgi:hypothetical protein
MAVVAPHRKGRIAFGAITSSLSSEVSTGNWTFTNALIEGLTGQGTTGFERAYLGILIDSEIAPMRHE